MASSSSYIPQNPSNEFLKNFLEIIQNDIRSMLDQAPQEALSEIYQMGKMLPLNHPNVAGVPSQNKTQKPIQKKSIPKPKPAEQPVPSHCELPISEYPDNNWNDLMAEDAEILKNTPQVHLPFSDLYLGAMAPKYCKAVLRSKFANPAISFKGSFERVVGLKDKEILSDMLKNPELMESLRATISKLVKERISHDPDYDKENFKDIASELF